MPKIVNFPPHFYLCGKYFTIFMKVRNFYKSLKKVFQILKILSQSLVMSILKYQWCDTSECCSDLIIIWAAQIRYFILSDHDQGYCKSNFKGLVLHWKIKLGGFLRHSVLVHYSYRHFPSVSWKPTLLGLEEHVAFLNIGILKCFV